MLYRSRNSIEKQLYLCILSVLYVKNHSEQKE